MSSKLLFFVSLVILMPPIKTNAQVLISPMGGFLQNSSLSLSYSAGEVISGDFSSEAFSFNSGFSALNNGILISNEELDNNLPKKFILSQNYPNPFNPSTNIEFSLPVRAEVQLEIYNSIGRKVAVLIDETKQAGYHAARFDASALSSGMYFYRLITNGNIISTKKMILIK